jgi:hydrogenase expression/formation protein HypC
MRIKAIDGALATIAAEGLEQRASLALVPEAVVGDYVLVHAGYAITVMDATEAAETYGLLREIVVLGEDAEAAEAAEDADAPGPGPTSGAGDDAG